MTVLLAVVCSILLMGILLLALWKLVITIHDRREFSRFQSARSRARYEMVRIYCTKFDGNYSNLIFVTV